MYLGLLIAHAVASENGMATYLDVPAELFVDKLQQIPARQIQLAGLVCQRFRGLIDENMQTLADGVYSRESVRLTQHIKYNFEYDISQVSFPDALR